MRKVTKVFYDSPLDIMKIILPIGFCSENAKQGYAHLIEHLLIRRNYTLLRRVESEGGWFNGTTKENEVEIDIYIANKECEDSLERLEKEIKLVVQDISQKEFEEEINVIKEEYRTLTLSNNPIVVEKRIGNIAQIDAFDITEANSLLESVCDRIHILMMSDKYLGCKDIEDSFDIDVNIKKDDFVIDGNNRYSLYVLKILALVLKENGYSENICFLKDSLYLSKKICTDVDLRAKAIGDRFNILLRLSFSKYNTYLKLTDGNWDYIYDFDVCRYWRRINEKINCLS